MEHCHLDWHFNQSEYKQLNSSEFALLQKEAGRDRERHRNKQRKRDTETQFLSDTEREWARQKQRWHKERGRVIKRYRGRVSPKEEKSASYPKWWIWDQHIIRHLLVHWCCFWIIPLTLLNVMSDNSRHLLSCQNLKDIIAQWQKNTMTSLK